MPTRQEIQPQLPPPLSDHEGRPPTRGLDDEMGGLPPEDGAPSPRLPSVSRFQTYREKVGDAIPGYLSTRVEHDTDIRRLFRQTTPAILAHYLDAINRLDYYADVAETVGNVSLAAACATSKARCSAKGIELALGRSLNIHATISDQSQVPNWLDLPEAERQKYLHQRALLQLDTPSESRLDNPAERGVESAEEAVIEGQVEGEEDAGIPRSTNSVTRVGKGVGKEEVQGTEGGSDGNSGDRHTARDSDEHRDRPHPWTGHDSVIPRNVVSGSQTRRNVSTNRPPSETPSPSSPSPHPQGPPPDLDESRESTGEGGLPPHARKP